LEKGGGKGRADDQVK